MYILLFVNIAMSEAEKAEQKKLEKERRRQEKELRRQAKLKAKTKKMIRVSRFSVNIGFGI